MKKTVFIIALAASGLFVASCGSKTAEPAAGEDQTEQVAEEAAAEEAAAEEAAAEEAEQPASLADIVADAKANGANWSADEWKTQFKKALEAYKPFAVAMNEAQPAQLEEITKQYADFPTLIKEFAGLAQKADGGKDITDEWIQATMQELGIPQL